MRYHETRKEKWKTLDAYAEHPTGKKICPRCKQDMDINYFTKNSSEADGLQSHCKECMKLIGKEHRERSKAKWKDANPYEITKEKKCYDCKQILPSLKFAPARTKGDGLSSICKICYSRSKRMAKFGIPEPLSNSCDICGSIVVLSIDHCHASGKVRGTLCRHCNTGLGLFRDSVTRLELAISYLKERG